jgi:hypothetical protein
MMEIAKKARRGVGIVTLIGFLVTAAAIIAIPLLVVKAQNRDGLFAVRIVWMEFLAVLLWGAVGGFFFLFAPADKNRRGLGGVYPVIGIITFFYVAISFIFMLIQWLIPASVFLAAAQIPAQIVLLVAYVVLGVVLFFALAGARGGTKRMPEGVPTPAELDAMLRTEEERLRESEESGSLREAIKALREKIHYSLPQAGRIADSSAYAAFTGDVRTLYNEVSALDLANAESAARFGELAAKAKGLHTRVDVIVENLKRK